MEYWSPDSKAYSLPKARIALGSNCIKINDQYIFLNSFSVADGFPFYLFFYLPTAVLSAACKGH